MRVRERSSRYRSDCAINAPVRMAQHIAVSPSANSSSVTVNPREPLEFRIYRFSFINRAFVEFNCGVNLLDIAGKTVGSICAKAHVDIVHP